MSGYLLDVNVLIALLHEEHVAHRKARRWFEESKDKGWATCALTQAGFVRISSNPRFSDHPPDIREALAMLSVITRLPTHRFWPIDFDLQEAIAHFQDRLYGYRQLTDAYLLALAIKNRGHLVTLDRGIEALAGTEFAHYVTVLA